MDSADTRSGNGQKLIPILFIAAHSKSTEHAVKKQAGSQCVGRAALNKTKTRHRRHCCRYGCLFRPHGESRWSKFFEEVESLCCPFNVHPVCLLFLMPSLYSDRKGREFRQPHKNVFLLP